MNRYTARHKILEYFKLEMDKQTNMIPLLEIDYDLYCNSIKGLTPGEVSTYLIIMRNEGYFKFREEAKEKYAVQITPKGLIDFADRKFQRKRRNIVFKIIKEWTITIANLIVALVAVYAIRKPNELKQLEAELKQLNLRVSKVEGIATPSTQRKLYNYQSTQLDSSR